MSTTAVTVLFLLWCLVVSTPRVAGLEDGIMYVVPANKRDCFYRELSKDAKMDLDMQVVGGGSGVEITVEVIAPTGSHILHRHRVQELSENLDAVHPGTYEICFDNTFSQFANKVVYFDLGVIEEDDEDGSNRGRFQGVSWQEESREEFRDLGVHTRLVELMTTIRVALEETSAQQAYAKARMSRHQYLQNHNLGMVTAFSGVSCVLMMLVAALQAYFVKKMFQ